MSPPPLDPTEAFCYLTTTGRITGSPHTIEIWFALQGDTIYLLSGGGRDADWVRNIERIPEVGVRVGDAEVPGRGRVVLDDAEDELARRLVYEKYSGGYGGDLTDWRRRALPVAIDLSR